MNFIIYNKIYYLLILFFLIFLSNFKLGLIKQILIKRKRNWLNTKRDSLTNICFIKAYNNIQKDYLDYAILLSN